MRKILAYLALPILPIWFFICLIDALFINRGDRHEAYFRAQEKQGKPVDYRRI